jgi:hypothetical protein
VLRRLPIHGIGMRPPGLRGVHCASPAPPKVPRLSQGRDVPRIPPRRVSLRQNVKIWRNETRAAPLPAPDRKMPPLSKKWSEEAPRGKAARERMSKQCGRKCFLLPSKLKFPVCRKSCEPDCRGARAAYMRAKQHRYQGVAKAAKKLLRKCAAKQTPPIAAHGRSGENRDGRPVSAQ